MSLNKLTVAGIIVLLAGMGSSPAFADSFARNRYVTGTENITRHLEVDNIRTENGQTVQFSQSVKLNTDFPTASGELHFDGEYFHGSVTGMTEGIDPSVVGGSATELTEFTFTDETTSYFTETADIMNSVYDHTLTVGN